MTFWKPIKWRVLIFTIFHKDAAFQSVLLLYICTQVLWFYYPKCKTENDLSSTEQRWYRKLLLASQYSDSGGLQHMPPERSTLLFYTVSQWERVLLKTASPGRLTPSFSTHYIRLRLQMLASWDLSRGLEPVACSQEDIPEHKNPLLLYHFADFPTHSKRNAAWIFICALVLKWKASKPKSKVR